MPFFEKRIFLFYRVAGRCLCIGDGLVVWLVVVYILGGFFFSVVNIFLYIVCDVRSQIGNA